MSNAKEGSQRTNPSPADSSGVFAIGDDLPNPEDLKTFTDSKLNWSEVNEGKHAEMLAWTKALIQLRRCTVALNDGSMQHLMVSSDEMRRSLVLVRDEARIVVNLGTEVYAFDLLEGEALKLVSRDGVGVKDNKMELPGMTLAVLMSTTEQAEDREVH